MATRWSAWVFQHPAVSRRRRRTLLQRFGRTAVLPLIPFILSGDGHTALGRRQRNDLLPVREISNHEQLHTLTRSLTLPATSFPGPTVRVAEIGLMPFVGIYGGGAGDLGQEVLSLSAQVVSKGDASPIVHFAWVEFWEAEWCYGTHTMYNEWNRDSTKWRDGVGGCNVGLSWLTDYLQVDASIGFDYFGAPSVFHAKTQKLVYPNATCSTTQDVYRSFMVIGDTVGPCEATYSESVPLYGEGRDLWPKVADPYGISGDSMPGTGDSCRAFHVGTQDIDNGYLLYSRFNPCTKAWAGPIVMDSGPSPSHFLVSNPSVRRVVYAFCSPRNRASGATTDNDLVYYESVDDGLSWTSGYLGSPLNVTRYIGPDLERAYGDAAGAFTSDGKLHLVWVSAFHDSVAGLTSDSRCNVRHWSESVAGSNGPLGLIWSNVVVQTDWVPDGRPGFFNRNVCNLSVGIGDGSLSCPTGKDGTNRDFLYLLYTQYGSPDTLDLADTSLLGFQNGNLWLSVSPDGGRFWAKGACLTTIDSLGGTPTRSPGCYYTGGPDPCFSERSGTIAKRVGRTAHIAYNGDLNAGNTALEEAGYPVGYHMYLSVSAETTRVLCPETACSDSLSCGDPGDLTQDSTVDVFDVISSIEITFAGHQPPDPPGCPWDVSDVNCDGVVDVFDVISLIDYTFQGGARPPNPCRCRTL